MAGIFISYSRKDKLFTQKFVQALQRDAADVWIDWEDIPPSSDWQVEIQKGIANSDAVVCILSPDYAVSNECAKEVAIAAQYNKRLFPIICRDVDPATISKELASRNWIFFRDSDDFDAALGSLRKSLETDLDWVSEHTRLLTRSLEWQIKEQNAAFLLRGADLQNAEQWLARSGGNKQPTALQQQYILASRQDASRRGRLTLIGVSVALIVSVALGIAAVTQWIQANAQRNFAEQKRVEAVSAGATAAAARDLAVAAEATAVAQQLRAEAAEADAKREAQIAFARQLAADSGNSLQIDPERALLLALESVKAYNPPLPESVGALHDAVAASRVRLTMRGHTASLSTIEYHPDGSRIVTVGEDYTVRLWDAVTGEEIASTELKYAEGAIFTPDGEQLVAIAGDEEDAILFWLDPTTLAINRSLTANVGQFTSMAMSWDGSMLAAVQPAAAALILDTQTGEEIIRLGADDELIFDLAFSPDGAQLATADIFGVIKIWDIATGQELVQADNFGVAVYTIAYSPDGATVLTGDSGGTVSMWNADTLGLITYLYAHSDFVNDVVFSASGKRFASVSTDGTAKIWSSAGRLEMTLTGHLAGLRQASFSPDETRLVTASADGTAKSWDITVGGNSELFAIQAGSESSYIAFNPDGSSFAAAVGTGDIYLYDAMTGALVNEFIGHDAEVTQIAFSGDGSILVSGSFDGTARLWDTASGQTLHILGQHQTGVRGAGISSDGRRVVTAGDDMMAILWDAATGAALQVFHDAQQFTRNSSAAITPDGTRIAVSAGAEYNIRLWNTETGELLKVLKGHTTDINDVAFSHDGRYLLSSSWDRTALIWEVETGEVVFTLRGHLSVVNDATFNADSTLIATASSDESTIVWDRATGVPLFRLPAAGETIASVSFSPDSQRLVAASQYGTIFMYTLDVNELVGIARSRLTRTLTQDECVNYLHLPECPPN